MAKSLKLEHKNESTEDLIQMSSIHAVIERCLPPNVVTTKPRHGLLRGCGGKGKAVRDVIHEGDSGIRITKAFAREEGKQKGRADLRESKGGRGDRRKK